MSHTGLVTREESTALRRFLFRDSMTVEKPGEIVSWWERRRIPFNVAVGVTGVVTISVANIVTAIGPAANPWGLPPLLGVMAYGVLANVMFTSGWVAELLTRPLFGRRTGTIGATMFRYGLVFSLGLTTLPIAASMLDLGFRILKWVLA